jgi:predicted transposase/invertase (TIGR01784 family)
VDDSPPIANAANADLATHPNDAFFKSVFSEPAHAVAFFQNHLPAAIATRIDWATLELVPTSFVKSTLRQVHSDLIFSVRVGERETLLYLLFEHQSTVDPAMPLRLLGYLSEILIQHHHEHGLPLPPVIPFVFHQGPETWQVSTAFESLI